jgi:hypothetical protein
MWQLSKSQCSLSTCPHTPTCRKSHCIAAEAKVRIVTHVNTFFDVDHTQSLRGVRVPAHEEGGVQRCG